MKVNIMMPYWKIKIILGVCYFFCSRSFLHIVATFGSIFMLPMYNVGAHITYLGILLSYSFFFCSVCSVCALSFLLIWPCRYPMVSVRILSSTMVHALVPRIWDVLFSTCFPAYRFGCPQMVSPNRFFAFTSF
jgi:hypothetical protein